MKVFVRVKALGKKRCEIQGLALEIRDGITDVSELIAEIVGLNVSAYNKKQIDKPVFKYLTKEEILTSEKIGKVGFSDRKNENTQDEQQAVENALLSFKDGIFRVFVNDDEINIDDNVSLNENDEITFVRLVMMAGRLW